MKRLITWAIVASSYTLTANAQLALPYENGFDTPAENDDWIIYRRGITDEDGSHIPGSRCPLPALFPHRICFFTITRWAMAAKS